MKHSLCLALATIILLGSPLAGAAPAASDLKSTTVPNELGLHLNEYAFSWKGEGQTAYRILMASDERKLAVEVGDLWDSGRRESGKQSGVLCRGRALADGDTVWWKVMVWDEKGEAGDWSAPGKIEVPAKEAADVADVPRNRIVLLGGTLISRMEKYGSFETAVTVRWPHHNISVRNLGWPADNVFGTARSEFGSAQNTRSWQPPKGQQGFGFEKLKKQLGDAQPSTVIVGYGAEAAFIDTDEKMERFEEGYRALVDELERMGTKLVLLTPIKQAKAGLVLPDPTEPNARLERASKFILALAKVRGHGSVDLFKIAGLKEGDYENGVHLRAPGYWRIASALTRELKIPEGGASISMGEEGLRTSGGQQAELESTKRGVRFDFTSDQLPSPTRWREASINAPLRVVVDGKDASVDAQGGFLRSGADHVQTEELRQAIVEKNKIYRYRLNPINKAYIFLFRRHEMGHLAYEMEDFEEIVEGREQVIAKVRVPRTHRYVVERAQDWKAPRDYPDHEVPKDVPAPNVAAELKSFEVAEGFQVNLFAQNPMIFNPINMNWDRHGRAWVSTSSTYPHIKPGRIPNDRIVILEDLDHDGVADTHKVFAEGLTVPHSVMPVEGGAYVCSTTEVLFLGDADGDDVADSRRVVFSGFGNADVHHMIHGLRWTPWGDLFFTQSIYINSFVETAHGPRRLNGSGIWRFRPETERLEIFSRGMVNPWGLAFDYWGRGFGTDGAGGSGPHDVFPGSAFGTAVGAPRVMRGLIPGKPKNTAAEFMTGRHIPTHWQGSMLGNDFRANRTVRYELEERGSGFAAKEVETVLRSSHRSFRPVDIKMGPDGAIYVVDWYNPIIDHGEVDFHHPLRDKSHGRIWRLTVRDRDLVERPKIAEATNGELLDHLKAPEQYTRTQANRELVWRKVSAAAIDAIVNNLDPTDPEFDHHRLEALWLCTALNHKPIESLWQLLAAADPRIRAAAVRVAGRKPAGMKHLALAVEDEHPRVRLAAVCALRELGSLEAANLALRALDYEVDGNLDFALEMTVRDTSDQWLPAMQAGKIVFDGNAGHLSYALKKVKDPRAIEALSEVVKKGELKGDDLANAVATVAALGEAARIGEMLDLTKGAPELLIALARGAEFSSTVPPQSERAASYLSAKNEAVRIAAAALIGYWKVSSGKDQLTQQAAAAQSTAERLAMTTALASLGATDALTELWVAGKSASVRAAAIAAQARLSPKSAAAPAVQILGKLVDADDARIVFEGFLAREEGPGLLAQALANAKLSETVALAGSRSASASGREVGQLIAALNKAGGLKPVSQALSPEERRVLIADVAKMGSSVRGRQVYERTAMVCTTCHLVSGKGGKLGPDLSTVGSYMTPESILESLLNPSTDIKQGYETVMVTKKDKTLVSGLLQRKTDNSILVRDPTGKVVSIPSGEVAKVDTSPVSLMPPGLTSSLRRDELVDLMKYLTSLGK